MLKVKRIYEKPSSADGKRIFIDRIWPRGLDKNEAKINFWLRGLAPSAKLRKWYSHDPRKWDLFKEKYFNELRLKKDLVEQIKKIQQSKTVTLVYSSSEKRFNQAVALKEYLERY